MDDIPDFPQNSRWRKLCLNSTAALPSQLRPQFNDPERMAALDVPAEIWGKIFESCCNDGGRTGRSLALVSRYIHAVSKPYQYHSVALVGRDKIARFAELLDTDHECRRVKNLFISTFKPEKSVLDYVQGCTLRTSIPPPPTVHDDNFTPDAKYEVITNMYRVFEAVAPSLETLHVVMGFYRDNTFFPIVFPSLVELTIQGPFHDHEDCSDAFCYDTLHPPTPSLRRLYLTDVFTCVNDRTYSAIKHYTPYLTHLRIQCADGYIESSKSFLRQLSPGVSQLHASSGTDDDDTNGRGDADRDDEQPQFPESLKRILLHPGSMLPAGRCGTSYMMRHMALRSLAKFASEDPRIVLFNESPWMWPYSTAHGYIEGQRQWLDRIAGGDGCWEEM